MPALAPVIMTVFPSNRDELKTDIALAVDWKFRRADTVQRDGLID